MIFFGAGASQPFGINTSKELTDLMSEKIRNLNSDLLSDIESFYSEALNMEPDFEMMLTQLTAYSEPSQIDPMHPSLIFSRQNPQYKNNYSEIISEIYEGVCKTCTAPFIQGSDKFLEPEKLEEIFALTYDAIFGVPLTYFKTRKILVFSTNYDPSVEIWCQKRNLNCLDGTQIRQNPELKTVKTIEQHIQELREFTAIREPPSNMMGLVRLHGSVWTYRRAGGGGYYKFTRPRDKLLFPDLYQRLRADTPELIFPGQENNLRIGRWDDYYQYFKDNLVGNCLFIGYSFRHQVINEQIRSNIDAGTLNKLGIFAPNPDVLLNNLFQGREIPRDVIIEIPGYFGTVDGLWELNLKWFPEYFRKQYQYKNQPLDRSREWQKENKTMYI